MTTSSLDLLDVSDIPDDAAALTKTVKNASTKGQSADDMPEATRQVLQECVRTIVGRDDVPPRIGQARLLNDLADAYMRTFKTDGELAGQVIGKAPTGVGKSMAYLAPAATAAALLNQRTAISTEMISLQTQIIDKDAPVVADAVEKVTGYRPKVALLKGWSNYACFDGDERFVTSEGLRRFRDVVGQRVRVLDGNRQWTEAEVRSFGEQPVTRLVVSRNNVRREIVTTADHRWFVNPNANFDNHIETVTRDLKPGDRLAFTSVKNKVLGRSKPSPVGICAGLVFGDGSRFASTDGDIHQGACTIPLHGQKNIDLVKWFDGIGTWGEPYERDAYAEPIVRVSNLPSFFKSLPDPTWNTSYLYGWLAGYFAADGSVAQNGSASIGSANIEHIEFVMNICERLGIAHGGHISTISRKGMNTVAEETDFHRLAIHTGSLDEDFFLVDEHRRRFLDHRLSYKRFRSTRRWKVEEVIETEEMREVFCAVVPTTQSFALAGNILTGNCTAATVDAAEQALDITVMKTGHDKIKELHKRIGKAKDAAGPGRKADGTLDFSKMPRGVVAKPADRERLELIEWALDEAASLDEKRPDGTGDKNTYEGNMSDSFLWESVSVSSSDCIGFEKCAFADQCLPKKAREAAAEADVIVTNHHLLAVQAAKGVPVVVGSSKLGPIDHLVIDEAHGLPSIVRSQGSVEVSSRTIKRTIKSITRVMDDTDSKVLTLVKAGEAIADRVEMELDEWAAKIKRGEDVYRLVVDEDPVNDTSVLIENWCKNAHQMLNAAGKSTANVATHMKIRRAKNALDALEEAVKLVSEHDPATARWVEVVRPHFKAADQKPYPSAQFTPVDVASMLRFNLWTIEDEEAVEAQVQVHEGDGPPPRKQLTVAALSATLPKGFGRQMGMRAPVVEYESPFDDAYGASVLFVPRTRPGSEDVEMLKRPFPGKPKFDTSRHTEWAVPHVLDLVEANGGSALILAATASAGRVYAERLQAAARGRWNVLSQWDGPALRKQVADWKADTNSVLIGTKSLMTGVDASGATCTLVIIDRPARGRSNPVDDARVEMLMNDAQMDRWAADRLVYVADAGALLEQGAGRLIRTVTDSGMVAVLDPRLLKTSPFAYNAATRNDYLETLHRFQTKISDPAKATAWLREHRAKVAARSA